MTDVTFRLTEDRERLQDVADASDVFVEALHNGGVTPETVLALARAALDVLEVEYMGTGISGVDWIWDAVMHLPESRVGTAAVLRALIGEEER